MVYRRWIYVLIDIVAHSLAVYSEVSIFLHLYTMMWNLSTDKYNLSMMELEMILVAASVMLSVVAETLIDKVDKLEEKGHKIWEHGLLPKL